MEWSIYNLEGLIPLTGGVVLFLYAQGVLPKSPKQGAELIAEWRKKYGLPAKILSVLVMLFGLLQISGILTR